MIIRRLAVAFWEGRKMHTFIRQSITSVLVALIMFSSINIASAQEGVDWETATVTVTGMGIAPSTTVNYAQARMLARRAAVVDGYRQLSELIKGVNVDAESTVGSMMLTSDVINTKVSACIQGAKVIAERITPDGAYEVTMVVPIYGVSSSLASAVLTRPTIKEPFPLPNPNVMPSSAPSTTVNVNINITQNTSVQQYPSTQITYQSSSALLPFCRYATDVSMQDVGILSGSFPSYPTIQQQDNSPYYSQPSMSSSQLETANTRFDAVGDYTSLVIDCTGLGLKPAMSPVIQNANGEAIYGAKNLDYDVVVSKGMAAYVKDIEQLPKISRTGEKPLIVKGNAVERHSINPVISVADANRILLENEQSHFLDQLNVIFLQ